MDEVFESICRLLEFEAIACLLKVKKDYKDPIFKIEQAMIESLNYIDRSNENNDQWVETNNFRWV